MSEFDPNILRRNLPEDIHAVIDQVNANVTVAVRQVVDEFRAQANAAADQFAQGNFSGDLQSRLDQVRADVAKDLTAIQDALAQTRQAAQKAADAAKQADPAALNKAVSDLTDQAKAVEQKLQDFRTKVDTFAQKTGGLIAKAAISTFTGGI